MNVPFNDKFISERGIYILTELDIMDFDISHKNEALFVVDISDSAGKNYHYYTFPIRNTPPRIKEIWKKERYSIEMPEVRSPSDKLKLYIWNKAKENFWIKELKIDVIVID